MRALNTISAHNNLKLLEGAHAYLARADMRGKSRQLAQAVTTTSEPTTMQGSASLNLHYTADHKGDGKYRESDV